MKKKGIVISILLVTGLLAGAVAYAIPSARTWINENIFKIPDAGSSDDSSSEVPSETPVFNIAEHGTHRFDAVNDSITLTATVTPAEATDKTIVWTTSNADAVAITSTTSTSATIKCVAAFSTSVTITARATNGTVDESDDFTATCVCSYYVAVESIDLQLWEVTDDGTDAIIDTYDTQITDLTDIPLDTLQKYAFKVVYTPSNATLKGFSIVESIYGAETASDSGLVSIDCMDGLSLFAEDDSYDFLNIFSFNEGTNAGVDWDVSVVSADNASATDALSISVGTHLATGDLAGTMVAFSNDNVTYMSSQTLAVWENNVTYETYTDVGTYVRITLPNLGDVVQGAYTVTANATYFTIVDDGDNDISGGAVIIVQLAGATGATAQNVTINFTDYAAQTVNVPFLVANAKVNVTGISLDNTTATF